MTKRETRRYGVKIRNPLRLPVVARVRSETGAIRMGAMNGKETRREIGPGGEIFVATKGSCDLDVSIGIVRYEYDGMTKYLGEADFRCIDHRDAKGGTSKKAPLITPVEFTSTVDVDTTSKSVPITTWQVDHLREGKLLNVAIDIQPMEPLTKGKAWVIIRDAVGDKWVDLTPVKLTESTTLDFKRETTVPPGHKVVIVGRSTGGITRFTGVITGEEMPAIARVPTRVTKEKKRKPVQEEEVEIHSLGDLLRDRAREEVAV